jgi:CHASE3 domain sensor protein
LAAIFAAVVVSTALLFWATAASIASARSSLQTIGHRTAPQIVAAQGIYFSLSDMDAQVANYLLVGKRNLGSTEDDAVRAYNQDADVATSGLVAAANHATGSAERDLVQSMLSGAIAYQGFASHAEILTDQGDTTGALAQERQATDLMHDRVLPAATKLNDLALQSLNGTYAAQKRQSTRGVAVVLGVGLLLLSVLAGAQWFLFRRTRRLLNLGLVQHGPGFGAHDRCSHYPFFRPARSQGGETGRLRLRGRPHDGPGRGLRGQRRREPLPDRPGPSPAIPGCVPDQVPQGRRAPGQGDHLLLRRRDGSRRQRRPGRQGGFQRVPRD